jgi:hypothetical protein
VATIVKSENFISITAIAADVTQEQIFNNNGRAEWIRRITFIPAGDADVCEIQYGDANGAILCKLFSGDAGLPAVAEFGGERGAPMKIFIDFDGGTYTENHILLIELA